jgi:hypothetical protein
MAINEGRQNGRITENRSARESQSRKIRKSAVYSRITVTLPTFAILMLRRFAERESGKHDRAETVSTLLEGWILALLNPREIDKAAKASPEFRRVASAWVLREERVQRERAKQKRRDSRAKRVKP